MYVSVSNVEKQAEDLKFEIEMKMTQIKSQTDQVLKDIEDLKKEIPLLEKENKEKKKEIDEAKKRSLCKECKDRQINTLLMPCTHYCVCFECFNAKLSVCPVCRKDVSGHFKVHVA